MIVCGSPSKNYLRPLGAAVGHAEAAVLGDEHRAIFWRRCRLDRLRRGLRMRRAGSPGAVRTRRWCGSMKKTHSVALRFRMMLFFALNDLLKETYGFHGWHCTNRKLPVLFLSGGDDPCYVNVRRFKKSIDHMRLIGYRNVRGKLYPGMRHEILNEKEKYRVYGECLEVVEERKSGGECGGGKHTSADPGRRSGRGAAVFDHFLKKTLISKKTDERFSMKVNF